MPNLMYVKDARRILAGASDEEFAREVGINVSEARRVRRYVQDNSVPEDSLAILSKCTLADGTTLYAGNISEG